MYNLKRAYKHNKTNCLTGPLNKNSFRIHEADLQCALSLQGGDNHRIFRMVGTTDHTVIKFGGGL